MAFFLAFPPQLPLASFAYVLYTMLIIEHLLFEHLDKIKSKIHVTPHYVTCALVSIYLAFSSSEEILIKRYCHIQLQCYI